MFLRVNIAGKKQDNRLDTLEKDLSDFKEAVQMGQETLKAEMRQQMFDAQAAHDRKLELILKEISDLKVKPPETQRDTRKKIEGEASTTITKQRLEEEVVTTKTSWRPPLDFSGTHNLEEPKQNVGDTPNLNLNPNQNNLSQEEFNRQEDRGGFGGYRQDVPPWWRMREGEGWHPGENNWRRDCKPRRIEMATFNGEDPDNWVSRAERFFLAGRYTDQEKVEIATLSFDGAALAWYRNMENRGYLPDWAELKALVFRNFRRVHQESVYQRFLSIEQEGSVVEYRDKFWTYAAACGDISPDIELNTFIKGLQPHIRSELMIFRPRGFNEAVETALRIEEKNKEVRNYRFCRQGTGNKVGETRGSQGSKPIDKETNKGDRVGASGYKRLTPAEWQEKMSKGLCFRCDEKYNPGHRCRNKQLQVLLLQEEEEDGEDLEEARADGPSPRVGLFNPRVDGLGLRFY